MIKIKDRHEDMGLLLAFKAGDTSVVVRILDKYEPLIARSYLGWKKMYRSYTFEDYRQELVIPLMKRLTWLDPTMIPMGFMSYHLNQVLGAMANKKKQAPAEFSLEFDGGYGGEMLSDEIPKTFFDKTEALLTYFDRFVKNQVDNITYAIVKGSLLGYSSCELEEGKYSEFPVKMSRQAMSQRIAKYKTVLKREYENAMSLCLTD